MAGEVGLLDEIAEGRQMITYIHLRALEGMQSPLSRGSVNRENDSVLRIYCEKASATETVPDPLALRQVVAVNGTIYSCIPRFLSEDIFRDDAILVSIHFKKGCSIGREL